MKPYKIEVFNPFIGTTERVKLPAAMRDMYPLQAEEWLRSKFPNAAIGWIAASRTLIVDHSIPAHSRKVTP